MHSYNDSIKPVAALAPYSHAGDDTAIATAIIDTQGFAGLEFVIATGVIGDADATFAVTMEQGDDSGLSDTAAVATANLDGTLAAAGFIFSDDGAVRKIGVKELTKRYYRLTITPTGNTGTALLAVIAILFAPRKSPTT